MGTPLKVGEVHVGNEEDGLGVEVGGGLEHRDVHPLVGGQQRHFGVSDWEGNGDSSQQPAGVGDGALLHADGADGAPGDAGHVA